MEWYTAGYFPQDLMLRRTCDHRFVPLSEMIALYGMVPFAANASMAPRPIEDPRKIEEALAANPNQVPPELLMERMGMAYPNNPLHQLLIQQRLQQMQQQQQQGLPDQNFLAMLMERQKEQQAQQQAHAGFGLHPNIMNADQGVVNERELQLQRQELLMRQQQELHSHNAPEDNQAGYDPIKSLLSQLQQDSSPAAESQTHGHNNQRRSPSPNRLMQGHLDSQQQQQPCSIPASHLETSNHPSQDNIRPGESLWDMPISDAESKVRIFFLKTAFLITVFDFLLLVD